MCKWIVDEAFLKFRQVGSVKFGELVADLRLEYEESFGQPCTNWSGAGDAFPMSPRQGKINQL